ncbi:MAG: hypothetical protein Q7R35_17365 [Elusimicrobiota bacterium]|nr:hypothetical protein [Elusimicrobiota bacterium]
MNKKIVMWAAVIALVSGPAINLMAQEGPGEEEEIEMMEGGPGRPEMRPERPDRSERPGMGQEKMQIKIKKFREGREGKEKGGPGFMEDEIMAVVTKHDPAFAKKLGNLRESAPRKYKMVLMMSGKMLGMAKMEQDESLEKDAVRGMSLEFESKELSLKYDKAPDADKKAIKDSLRGILAELFDLKTKGQELRVKFMEKEMAKLRKNLESRKLNKDKIVGQRLEQMTGEGTGW